jgi:hypothetical protein
METACCFSIDVARAAPFGADIWLDDRPIIKTALLVGRAVIDGGIHQA